MVRSLETAALLLSVHPLLDESLLCLHCVEQANFLDKVGLFRGILKVTCFFLLLLFQIFKYFICLQGKGFTDPSVNCLLSLLLKDRD